MASGLTHDEEQIMLAMMKAWNLFNHLPVVHPDHLSEFRHGVHALQNILAAHVVAREHDDYWLYQAVSQQTSGG